MCRWLVARDLVTFFVIFVSGCGDARDTTRRLDVVFPIQADSGWGAIDKQGNVLVAPTFELASLGFGRGNVGASQHVAQQGLLLISGNEWCYVNSHEVRRIKPLMSEKETWRVFNYGESLFGIEIKPDMSRFDDTAPLAAR